MVNNLKLQFDVYCEDNIWIIENSKFDIYATGSTLDIAVIDFSEQLIYFYYHYTELPKSKCLKKALELKKLYQETFEDVV